MTKVILFKGKFKIKPPFNDEQLRDINNDYHFDEFDLANDCLTCKGTLREFRGNRGFKDIEYIIKNYKRSNKLKGEVIGLKFDKDRYKFCKWFIKYNTVKDEFIECNITKKGKTRGKREKPQRPTMEVQTDQPSPPTSRPRTNNLTRENQVIFSNASDMKTSSLPKGQLTLKQFMDKHKTTNEKDVEMPSLSAEDFSSLNDGEEVSDVVIDAYITINNKKRKDKRKIAVEHSFFVDCIMQKQYKLIEAFENYKNKGVKYYDYIIFPLNFEYNENGELCSHWILCIIDIKEQIIKIYDSGGNKGYIKEVNKINAFLLHEKFNKFKVEYIHKPRQISGSDCGVFVSEYAKRWLLNEPIDFTYEDIPQIKNRMRNELRKCLTDEAKQQLIQKSRQYQSNTPENTSHDLHEKELDKILQNKENINCLDENKCVSNKTITAYLCLLYLNTSPDSRKRIGLTDDTFMHYITIPNGIALAAHNAIGMNGHKFSEYTYFVIPFSIKSNVKGVDGHAVLAIINTNLHDIEIYDSDNPNKDKNNYKMEVDAIKKFLKAVGCKDKYSLSIVNKPQQNTEIDCGVFVMEYARCKLFGKPANFTQNDIKNIRSRIKQELMTRTIKQ